jgi:hypothetical protein
MKNGIRMLLTGTYEGKKWIEIGMRSRDDGRWKMSNGVTLMGVTHWLPLSTLEELNNGK